MNTATLGTNVLHKFINVDNTQRGVHCILIDRPFIKIRDNGGGPRWPLNGECVRRHSLETEKLTEDRGVYNGSVGKAAKETLNIYRNKSSDEVFRKIISKYI